MLQEQLIEDSPEPYDHWTLKEIHEQPKSIMAAINNGARIFNNEIALGGLDTLESIIETRDIDHIIALGCGTSHHVCLFAKYYFNGGVDPFTTIQACDASEFSSADIPKKGNTLCILCSQSGETRDLITCIEVCKQYKCILVGIVNVVDSMIPQSVDCGVYLNAGYERAVASTKSFTSSLVVLSLIGMWFREKYKNVPIIKSLRNLPNNIEVLLNDVSFKASCDNLVNRMNSKQIQSMFILGRGKMFAIAREGALKIKELSYIHAEGYSSSSLKHGPFALLDDKSISLLLMDEKNITNLESTYYEISARDTNCYVLTDTDTIITENIIRIPKLFLSIAMLRLQGWSTKHIW
jgi:glucosamine--fructose-6-phosphate aminotransferase (isomerizing)